MNFRNLKIGMQLRLGFGAMLLFVKLPGATADLQTDNAKDLNYTGLKNKLS
jgi:hypothetical protein